jgi:hypothetical protein
MSMPPRDEPWTRAEGSRLRRLLTIGSALLWPPRRERFLLRQLPQMAMRHAVSGLQSFWHELQFQERSLAAWSSVPIETAGSGYVIVAPSFTSVSAGIGCLYRLCDELNRRGFPSYITGATESTPKLLAPLTSLRKARHLCRGGYTAVYPETVPGNPLGARSVARWVLNRPGLLGGEALFDESELVFCYSDVFASYVGNRLAGRLYMPTIDEEIFFCDDEDISRRSLECFYVGKSTWKDGVLDRSRAFEITRQTPSKRELGKLFRAARVFYCFDNSTIMIYEALMCGCPVVVIPDGTQTKEDFQRLELGTTGIAWGPDELPGVTVDLPGLRERYQRVKSDFRTQFDNFISLTQSNQLESGQRRAA